MVPDPRYVGLPVTFWSYIRAISQDSGYSDRDGSLRTYSEEDVLSWAEDYGIDGAALREVIGQQGTLLELIVGYLNCRADLLEQCARPNLMDRRAASKEFARLRRIHKPKCKLPQNKQKGEKRHANYLVCMVNILTEAALGGCLFDADPQSLATVMDQGKLVCTMSRRMDGAYPSVRNPLAVWEVKEYYGTTTFGSRIADGVYETALDGTELQKLRQDQGIHVKHYLMVDDRFIWWKLGRSYLCRIADMLHSGLLDEVLFGKEVLTRWPEIARSWGA